MGKLGTYITRDVVDDMHPNKTDAWKAKHEVTLHSKFPSATRFTQRRINLHPNEDGLIEVEWTAYDD